MRIRKDRDKHTMEHAKPSSALQKLALDGLLTAILVLLGMLKLPSLIPGAEFQPSAPYAVCLAAAVGFRRYLGIGICSSLIQLLLGTHTIWNVLIAMVFRITAGAIAAKKPEKKLRLLLAGPIGTGCARLVLAAMLRVPALPLLAAAVPGMIFTAVCTALFYPAFCRAAAQAGFPRFGKPVPCRQNHPEKTYRGKS